MSPTVVQSRIAAYEARTRKISQQNTKPDSPHLAHKSSLIDLTDWVLDDMPPSPTNLTTPQLQLQPSSPPRQKPMLKPKPPALQMKNATKNPPLPPRSRSTTTDSTTSDTSFLYPPLGGREALMGEIGKKGNHISGSSISSFHSVSLSSDGGTDPGTPSSVATNMIATYPIDRVPSGSSSLGESFEEISIPPTPIQHALAIQKPPLPQRPKTMPPPTTMTPVAQHSHTSPPTPTPLPYVPRRVPPPPPTSRASDRSSIQSLASSTTNTGSSASRSSGNAIQTPTLLTTLPLSPSSSILSHSSTTSPSARSVPAAFARIKRPTPVPAAARKRYITVFNANIIQRRRAETSSLSTSKPKKLSHTEAKAATRTRQAAGWRGLSVDLITATPEELELADAKGKEKARELLSEQSTDENVGPDDRLEAGIVKLIWSRSRVDKSKLAEIWSECDPDSRGSLDIEAFIRGMWRIDEHLRRTQTQTSALRNANSTSLTALRSGLGSFRIKSTPGKHQQNAGSGGLHRSTSKSSLGTTSLSRSSSVNSRLAGSTNAYAEYPPPPPVPKIVLR